jgi:hypothetical protein
MAAPARSRKSNLSMTGITFSHAEWVDGVQ